MTAGHYIQALFHSGCAPCTTVSLAWLPVSATKQKRTALFWVIMQRVVVMYYQRFQTTLLVPSIGVTNPEVKMKPIGCPKTLVITTTCCIVTQKSTVLNYFSNVNSHLTNNTHCLDLKAVSPTSVHSSQRRHALASSIVTMAIQTWHHQLPWQPVLFHLTSCMSHF